MDQQTIHTLSSTGRHQECLQTCQQLLQSEPENPLPWKYAGKSLLALGQFDKAKQCLTKAYQLDNKDPEITKDIGNAFLNLIHTDEAIEWYEKTLQLNNSYAPALNNLANIKRQSGSFQEALDLYKQAIREDPKLLQAYMGSVVCCLKLGELNQGESLAMETIKINPKAPGIHEIQGMIYQSKKNYAQAIESYQKELTISPNSHISLLNLGLLLLEHGEAAAAIEPLTRAAGSNPSEECSLLLAQAYQDLGQLNKAIGEYKKVKYGNASNKLIHFNLGKCLLGNGNNINAIEAFRSAIRLDNSYAAAWGNLGSALVNEGRYQEALVAIQKVVELEPNNHTAHMNLGCIYKDLGRFNEALSFTLKSIELKSNNSTAHINLAIIYKIIDRLDQALTAILKAVELNPDSPSAYLQKGIIELYLSKTKEAQSSLLKAIDHGNQQSDANMYLSIIQCIKGDVESAKNNINEAIELDPRCNIKASVKAIIYGRSRNCGSKQKKVCSLNSMVKLFPAVTSRPVEPDLVKALYKIKPIDLTNNPTRNSKGNAKTSNFNFFKENRSLCDLIENDLTSIAEEAVGSRIYIQDSWFTILKTGGSVKKHCHTSELSRIKEFNITEQQFALVYYLDSGDQNSSEPGFLRFYEPDEMILPADGMVIIFPANRYHSVKYSGSKDRVMIAINFWSI